MANEGKNFRKETSLTYYKQWIYLFFRKSGLMAGKFRAGGAGGRGLGGESEIAGVRCSQVVTWPLYFIGGTFEGYFSASIKWLGQFKQILEIILSSRIPSSFLQYSLTLSKYSSQA